MKDGVKKYIPFDKAGCKYKELEVEVYYTKGGMNYFAGSVTPRGYKLSLHPVSNSGNGFIERVMMTSSTAPDRGIAFHLEDTNRFSAKRLQAIADKVLPLAEKFGDLFAHEKLGGIGDLLTTVEVDHWKERPKKNILNNWLAYRLKTDGTVTEVKPANGKYFVYDELRKFVGGMVEIVGIPDGRAVVCNEEGKLTGLPTNQAATALWKEQYPIAQYPGNNDELMVGDVLVCPSKMLDDDEDDDEKEEWHALKVHVKEGGEKV